MERRNYGRILEEIGPYASLFEYYQDDTRHLVKLPWTYAPPDGLDPYEPGCHSLDTIEDFTPCEPVDEPNHDQANGVAQHDTEEQSKSEHMFYAGNQAQENDLEQLSESTSRAMAGSTSTPPVHLDTDISQSYTAVSGSSLEVMPASKLPKLLQKPAQPISSLSDSPTEHSSQHSAASSTPMTWATTYQCAECGKAYTRDRDLQSHRRKKHSTHDSSANPAG